MVFYCPTFIVLLLFFFFCLCRNIKFSMTLLTPQPPTIIHTCIMYVLAQQKNSIHFVKFLQCTKRKHKLNTSKYIKQSFSDNYGTLYYAIFNIILFVESNFSNENEMP